MKYDFNIDGQDVKTSLDEILEAFEINVAQTMKINLSHTNSFLGDIILTREYSRSQGRWYTFFEMKNVDEKLIMSGYLGTIYDDLYVQMAQNLINGAMYKGKMFPTNITRYSSLDATIWELISSGPWMVIDDIVYVSDSSLALQIRMAT